MSLTMVPAYVLAYCRVVVGVLFMISRINKLRDLGAFQLSIHHFGLLPVRIEKISAFCFIIAEFIVSILVFLGGFFLLSGFLLAIFLLLLFSCVLSYALVRKFSTSCNCFGSSDKLISSTDLLRNAGFLLFASIGGGISAWFSGNQGNIGLIEWVLIVIGASIFTVTWIQVGEIVQFFHPS